MSCKSPEIPGTLFKPGWLTKFSEIKDQFKTGDIILVHGRYPFSWVVEFLQRSEYGHAAMVVRRDDLGLDAQTASRFPELLLWEANTLMTASNVRDLWRVPSSFKEGPMLISLTDRLLYSQNNYTDVYVVYKPLHIDRSAIDFTRLPAYFDSVIHMGFPTDREIIASALLGRKYNRSSKNAKILAALTVTDLPGGIRNVSDNFNPIAFKALGLVEGVDDPSKKEIYCSELIADTYKHLGILTKTHVSNAYVPADFSDEGRIRLLKRGWLGAEMFIDMCK
jgi:hypothetical protein